MLCTVLIRTVNEILQNFSLLGLSQSGRHMLNWCLITVKLGYLCVKLIVGGKLSRNFVEGSSVLIQFDRLLRVCEITNCFSDCDISCGALASAVTQRRNLVIFVSNQYSSNWSFFN